MRISTRIDCIFLDTNTLLLTARTWGWIQRPIPNWKGGWVTFANLHGAVWMDWSAPLSGGGKQMILSYLSWPGTLIAWRRSWWKHHHCVQRNGNWKQEPQELQLYIYASILPSILPSIHRSMYTHNNHILHIPYLPYDASSLHGHLSTIIHDHSRVLCALLQLLSRERLKEGLCRVLQDWKAAAKWGNDYFNICVSMHPYMCIRRTKNLFFWLHTHNKHVTAVFKLKLPRAHSGTLQLANRKFNGEKLCGGLGHPNCECWSGSMIFSGAGMGWAVLDLWILCAVTVELSWAAWICSYTRKLESNLMSPIHSTFTAPLHHANEPYGL